MGKIAGLTSKEAAEILKKDGFNLVEVDGRSHIFIEFIRNFTNPLVFTLLAVAFISFFLKDNLNGALVLTMVFLSVGLNFYQEHKANLAAEKLGAKVALMATVIRDGKEKEVPAKEICRGDLLVLNAGDLIPADASLFEAKDFFVNQSILTGEAFPVEKKKGDTIFSGTSVLTGTAHAEVLQTGIHTEFGKIATKLTAEEEENNFTHGIRHFSTFILRLVLTFVLFIFAINAWIKHDVWESLTFAIAVAVGLTPEFLPMIMTVTMSKGALLMARKGVIVKKLSAIPSFGSMNILCTDKTGTITEDQIRLVKYIDIRGEESADVLTYAYVNSSFQTGITNPLDKAITDFQKMDLAEYKKVDEIPFDFERRRLSIIVDHKSERLLITKGAPDFILPQSKYLMLENKRESLTEEWKQQFTKQYEKLSSEGYRVLALATKSIATTKASYEKEEEEGLTIIGFTAFLDPVKPNAKEAIDELEKIGIEVKVVTGDNELVTQKACEDAGIAVIGVLLGTEIQQLSDEALGERARNCTIFARFSPIEKERLVRVLRLGGNVVGYMGDGINDALSIKAADVGISVSNAVDVAKESADFILTHKSLMELKDGVMEGRVIFGNTMKYIMMGLSANFGNMFSVLGAVLFLPFLPMLPVQILLNNFLYDISQITIPSDNVDSEYLQKPKHWDMTFIRKFMLIFGPISSAFDFLTFFVLYALFSHNSPAFQTGWFLESLATQTLVIHVIRTRKIPFLQSRASKFLIISTLGGVFLGWIIPFTRVGHFFRFVNLSLATLIILALISLAYLVTVEAGKRLFYRNLVSSL